MVSQQSPSCRPPVARAQANFLQINILTSDCDPTFCTADILMEMYLWSNYLRRGGGTQASTCPELDTVSSTCTQQGNNVMCRVQTSWYRVAAVAHGVLHLRRYQHCMESNTATNWVMCHNVSLMFYVDNNKILQFLKGGTKLDEKYCVFLGHPWLT